MNVYFFPTFFCTFGRATEASRKLKSFLGAFLGASAVVEADFGCNDESMAAAGGVAAVGSCVPGKQTANVDVGCFDSQCVFASVFVLVSDVNE